MKKERDEEVFPFDWMKEESPTRYCTTEPKYVEHITKKFEVK